MRRCNESKGGTLCTTCNNHNNENKEFAPNINFSKSHAPNEFGHMLP